MKDKIAKGIFWIISMGLFVSGICFITNNQLYTEGVMVWIWSFIINPLLMDCFITKIGANKSNFYWYELKIFGICFGIFIAFIGAIFLYQLTNKNVSTETVALKDFEAMLQIVVFSVYLVVLFMWKSENKFSKYIIFGLVYTIFIILDFSYDPMNKVIISILDKLPNGSLDEIGFEILKKDFLEPIKEAILTYIIFDTAIELKKDRDGIKKRPELKVYDVNVSDKENNQTKDYHIAIK